MIAVDLRRPPFWQRLLDTTLRNGGTLLVAIARDIPGQHWIEASDEDIVQRVLLDLGPRRFSAVRLSATPRVWPSASRS